MRIKKKKKNSEIFSRLYFLWRRDLKVVQGIPFGGLFSLRQHTERIFSNLFISSFNVYSVFLFYIYSELSLELFNTLNGKSRQGLQNQMSLTFSLFQEEIGACAAVHTHYVMDTCDRVQPLILLPPMMGMSFMLVTLTRLIVSKPKHQVT